MVFHGSIKSILSKGWSEIFQVFISLFGILIGGEGNIAPGTFPLDITHIAIHNFPLHVLLLDEFIEFISQSSQAFPLLVSYTLQVKNVRLTLPGVVVDTSLSILVEILLFFENLDDVTQNSLILILLFNAFKNSGDSSNCGSCFPHIFNVEGNSCIRQCFFKLL